MWSWLHSSHIIPRFFCAQYFYSSCTSSTTRWNYTMSFELLSMIHRNTETLWGFGCAGFIVVFIWESKRRKWGNCKDSWPQWSQAPSSSITTRKIKFKNEGTILSWLCSFFRKALHTAKVWWFATTSKDVEKQYQWRIVTLEYTGQFSQIYCFPQE